MINIHQIGSWFLLAFMMFNPLLSGIKFSPQQLEAVVSPINSKLQNNGSDLGSSPAGVPVNTLAIPFSQMKFNGKTFSGIYDSTEILFRIPSEWALISGSQVTLNYSIRMSPEESRRFSAAGKFSSLYVHFNYWQIATIPLYTSGDFQINIPITQAMALRLKNDHSVLGVTFDNGDGCVINNGVSVFLDSASTLNLSYITHPTAPPLDGLPGPFFLAGNIAAPNKTTLVVPVNPSASELQSALSIAAGLGSLSSGQGELNLVTLDNLTDEVKKNNNIILVGKSLSLPILNRLPLLTALNNTGFASGQLIGQDDGVIQLINSPWNPSRALLLANGDTDNAVVKAGQSLRTNISVVPGFQSLAVIKNSPREFNGMVNPAAQSNTTAGVDDRQLKDFGYDDVVLTGIGTQSADYYFTVQPGQVIGNDAYLDLNVSPSSGLNLSNSVIVVRINDTPVYSAHMTKQLSLLHPRPSISQFRIRLFIMAAIY